MKKIKYIWILFSILFVFDSCYDDKGNYDYREVPKIIIDTTGVENRLDIYNLEMGKTLNLELNIIYTKNIEELNFYWLLYDFFYEPIQVGNEMVYPAADTISYKYEADWLVDRTGDFVLELIVEDPEIGIHSYFSFGYITIPEEGVQKGLYLLSEYDGMTDIEIYSCNLALVLAGEVVLPNYYSSLYGEMIPGKPFFISTNNQSDGYYYVFTDQDGWRLNVSGLQLMDTFSEMFYLPVNYNPQRYIYTNNCEFLINDDKLHVLYLNKTNDRKFSSAIAGDYTAAPFLIKNTRTNYGAIVGAVDTDQVIFDTKNNKFRPYFPSSVSLTEFSPTNPGAVIDVNNMPADIFYQLEGSNGDIYNFVNINGKDSLYIVSFYNVPDNGDFSIGGTPKISLEGCQNIRSAKYFASSDAGPAFFYATDSSVHSFSYTSGQTTQNDIYACNPGEIVTCIYQFITGGFPTSGCILWIAVWNETEKKGSLIEFEIDPISGMVSNTWRPSFGGEFQENPRRTDGFGKIISMTINL